MTTVPRRGPGGPWGRDRVLTPRRAVRIATLGGILLVGLGLLLVRLWFLQVVASEDYAQRADTNRLRTIRLEAPRGPITDREGRLIVTSRVGMNVVAQPRELEGRRGTAVLRRLAAVLDRPLAPMAAEVRKAADSPLTTVVLAEDVDAPVRQYLSERSRDFRGVELQEAYPRAYQQGATLAHVLGYTGQITAETIDDYRARGYQGDERVGTSGLEAQYEEFLAGTPGEVKVEVDAAGEPVGRSLASSVPPRRGFALELTVDLPSQRALEAALRKQVEQSGSPAGAAGVALEPDTGEVLAIASYPSYRPDAFGGTSDKAVDRLLRDPRRPLLNRALGGVYPAGSTFKVVTATAALEQGFLGTGDVLPSPGELTLYGQTFKGFESRSWGYADVRRALEVSSDTFFYELGARFYRDGARTPLQDWARRFGLGGPAGLDVPGEARGLVPDSDWKRRAFKDSPDPLDRSWKPGDSINLSTGQGNLLVTPLQMATAYAAIANGGRVITPSLGRRVIDTSGEPVRSLTRRDEPRTMPIGSETLSALRDGLLRAANEPNGTSTAVFGAVPEEARVAGKTGTAENETRLDHSWYVGYAPADDPRIVVAVVIEQGGKGANAAAPAVCQTMSAYLQFDPEACGDGATAN